MSTKTWIIADVEELDSAAHGYRPVDDQSELKQLRQKLKAREEEISQLKTRSLPVSHAPGFFADVPAEIARWTAQEILDGILPSFLHSRSIKISPSVCVVLF